MRLPHNLYSKIDTEPPRYLGFERWWNGLFNHRTEEMEFAARIKGIMSAVAGQADILLVPDLETGNILAKQLTFLNQAHAVGGGTPCLPDIGPHSRARKV